MEDSRLGKLTLGVKYCEASDVEVDNVEITHLNLKYTMLEHIDW